MEVNWMNFPLPVKRSLYEGIERLSSAFVPQGTANIIYRLYAIVTFFLIFKQLSVAWEE
jgi:hypothetical protein